MMQVIEDGPGEALEVGAVAGEGPVVLGDFGGWVAGVKRGSNGSQTGRDHSPRTFAPQGRDVRELVLVMRPGIRIADYMAFGSEPQGFDEVFPVNIVVGRNNSGKSALLHAVEFAVTGSFDPSPLTTRSGAIPRLVVSAALSQEDLQTRFRPNASGGHINGNHWAFGEQWLDAPFTWELLPSGVHGFMETEPPVPDNVRGDFVEIAKKKAVP